MAYSFFIGTVIAITGSYARTRLRETRDFIDAQQQIKNTFNKASVNIKILENDPIWKEKVHWKTSLSFFLIQCTWPVTFYITYIYCSNILKSSFNYTPEEIITHNFIVSIIQFFGGLILRAYLSSIIHPLKILKGFLAIFSLFILIFPYLLNNLHTPT